MKNLYNVGTKEYNSYLILDNKNILIDTVSEECFEEFKQNIEKYIKISEIDMIFLTRTEPAAVGCVKKLIEINNNISLAASVAGLRNLKEILNCEFCGVLAKEREVINIGQSNVECYMTPNLSWPDTMVVKIENVLFSGNLFCDNENVEMFSKDCVNKCVGRICKLDFERVLPAYGKEKNKDEALEYKINYKPIEPTNGVCIVYASKTNRTKKLAEFIEKRLRMSGINTITINSEENNKVDILKAIDSSYALAFGTSTVNHNALKPVLDVITHINITNNETKPVMIFGSYGWSGEGVHIIANLINNMKMRVFKKPYQCIFEPEETQELKEYIKQFAEVVKNA